MKVGIFTFPRTTSTSLVHRIGETVALPIFEEPLTHIQAFTDKLTYVHDVINPAMAGVFKFMNHNFLELNWQSINWKSFDKLIFLDRRNIAEACMSTYVAQSNQVWQYYHNSIHHVIVPCEVPRQHVTDFVHGIKQFNNIKQEIVKITDSITIFYEDYETYPTYVSSYLGISQLTSLGPYESSNLDYIKVCTNYDQVTNWVHLLLN